VNLSIYDVYSFYSDSDYYSIIIIITSSTILFRFDYSILLIDPIKLILIINLLIIISISIVFCYYSTMILNYIILYSFNLIILIPINPPLIQIYHLTNYHYYHSIIYFIFLFSIQH